MHHVLSTSLALKIDNAQRVLNALLPLITVKNYRVLNRSCQCIHLHLYRHIWYGVETDL